jgi:hypothetical protein
MSSRIEPSPHIQSGLHNNSRVADLLEPTCAGVLHHIALLTLGFNFSVGAGTSAIVQQ